MTARIAWSSTTTHPPLSGAWDAREWEGVSIRTPRASAPWATPTGRRRASRVTTTYDARTFFAARARRRAEDD